ncbi:hypothetical protein [Nannocystis bainbridge]|uniref:Uncharacterized protein n=1 Tax=Nannocystis bainbridge TaxID=2995303 RepID=A0ABT5DTC2_9BACT|nr:hypothetical protein [Nannocystis bainbridge]MDC0716891.1 hypothetical protein [Nannocystis bainbridge]
MTRRLLESMAFPKDTQVNPIALAEAVTEAFPVCSVVGGRGEQELRFVAPAGLVVVISATGVQCFAEPPPPLEAEDAEDEAEEDEEDEDDDDPQATAEGVLMHVAAVLGLEEEDEGGDTAAPDDAADRRATAIVAALLAEGLLELVTPRSRAQVEGRLAHLLAHGVHNPGALAESIADCSGVAEFYADDAQMAAVLGKAR